jgi:hypothetical protein
VPGGRGRTNDLEHGVRKIFVVAMLAACGARGPAATLPEPPAASLSEIQPMLPPGEQTSWQVFFQNIAIGRAELVIGARDARTTFKTGRLASALSAVRYELTTGFASGRVTSVDERINIDGAETDAAVEVAGASFVTGLGERRQVPGGTQLHTLQSALGVVRAWSKAAPHTGYLWLLHQGQLFRLDVFAPVADEALSIRALRVDGVIRGLDSTPPIDVSLWLAANRDRTPIKLVLRSAGKSVSAEVLESSASLEAR